MEAALAAMGVVVWPMVELEADDAIATAAARFSADPAVEQADVDAGLASDPGHEG